MSSPHRGEQFRHEVFRWRTWLVILLLFVLSLFLQRFWLLQYPGVVLMQAIDAHKAPIVAEHVVLVEINDNDYKDKKRFNEISPLNADQLKTIIFRILLQGPRLVAVDIDTAHSSFQSYRSRLQKCNIIWARGITLDEQPKPTGFMGFDAGEVPNAGIAVFPEDVDRGLRRFQSCVELNGTRMTTFHHAIALAFNPKLDKHGERCAENKLPGRPYKFNVITLKQLDGATNNAQVPESKGSPPLCSAKPASSENLFHNKIVLLGGTYSAADRHAGPGGTVVSGMKIVASAVETELESKKESLAFELILDLAVDVLLGLAVILIYTRNWSPPLKLAVTLVLAFAFLFLPGVLFYLEDLWTINPIFAVLGMMMHQTYEVNKPLQPEAHEHPPVARFYSIFRKVTVIRRQN